MLINVHILNLTGCRNIKNISMLRNANVLNV